MKITRLAASTQVGGIVSQHYASLPRWYKDAEGGPTWQTSLPWVGLYLFLPAVLAWWVEGAEVADPAAAVGGLLAGVGVLAGLLFQVLASVSGRIADLADRTDPAMASDDDIALVGRLDIARANIAYASMVSIVFVVQLGVAAVLKGVPAWVVAVSAFLLLHLGFTLVLVLTRINAIAQGDRSAALTLRARHRSARGPRKVA